MFHKYQSMSELPTTNETQFCEVGHQAFRDLINTRFNVPGDLVSTAKNIYHFVRDEIKYEDYSNTKKGAFRTLQERAGNCCDQAHLLVALLRTAGIPTYYAHGTNHWWAVPCIDKQYHCDPTNRNHQFGNPNNNHGGNHNRYSLHNSLNH